MKILKNELPELIKPKEELWFFDESRFGTHSKVGHAWYKTGIRTPVKIKLGYENFYLYSAVNPKTGEDFTLILPKVNTICINIFLEQFATRMAGRNIVIVMDGAAWHKSKSLRQDKNIRIIIQPAYSPELNPTERLWQHIKDNTIKNKVFSDLDQLETSITVFFNSLSLQTIQSICNINYI